MRLGPVGQEWPVVRLSASEYVDVSEFAADYDEKFFAADRLAELELFVETAVRSGRVARFAGERIGSPIARPHQILCIGLNYADHAAETGQPVPTEPIVFFKSPNTLVGPNDDVVQPRHSTKLDWEVELGIVIGRRAQYLETHEAAAAAIAGFVLVNDVSERSFQLERGGQWSKGKSAETFNPAGPWLATSDEISDARSLGLWLDVNGQRRQTGNTATMIFDPLEIVRYLSWFFTLEPGDLINTGTPPGVGMGLNPPRWLQPGDVVTLGIDSLGKQQQTIVPAR